MQQAVTWKVLYKTSFKKSLDFLEHIKTKIEPKKLEKLSQDKKKKLCDKIEEFFSSGCELIMLYLADNGMFVPNYPLAIKQAYNTEIVKDGQRWMNLFFAIKIYKDNGFENGGDTLLNFLCDENYTNLFLQLGEYLKKELKG